MINFEEKHLAEYLTLSLDVFNSNDSKAFLDSIAIIFIAFSASIERCPKFSCVIFSISSIEKR